MVKQKGHSTLELGRGLICKSVPMAGEQQAHQAKKREKGKGKARDKIKPNSGSGLKRKTNLVYKSYLQRYKLIGIEANKSTV